MNIYAMDGVMLFINEDSNKSQNDEYKRLPITGLTSGEEPFSSMVINLQCQFSIQT